MNMITELLLPGTIGERYIVDTYGDHMVGLSKVNVFVGPNNSGKSRFIRALFSNSGDRVRLRDLDLRVLNKRISYYCQKAESVFHNFGAAQLGNTELTQLQLPAIEWVKTGLNFLEQTYTLAQLLATFPRPTAFRPSGNPRAYDPDYQQAQRPLNLIGLEFKKELDDLLSRVQGVVNFHKIYVPTLRGLRTLGRDTDDYLKRTIDDYGWRETPQESKEIVTGLGIYRISQEHLLGDLLHRETMRAFEEFLSTELFEKKSIALIPKLKSDVLSVKIGCEKEQPIYNLGDGIQQIIIMMFPVFMNRDKDLLLFVEEPELYLHPGLQRKLLEILTSDKFPRLQCFLSTHSNHLLDMTMDMESISVYRFTKQVDESAGREVEAKFKITSTSAGDRGVLECLGVMNSSVFLTNCTIWVEGITDRMYLRRYLEIYQEGLQEGQKKCQEDTHYSFVEYSGNNITHWSFLDDSGESPDVDRLCGRLFLVTDKDSEKKLERQEKLKERLGERYHCLECREIENLLKPEIVQRVVSEYEGGEANMRPKVSIAKYADTGLGKFIEKQVLVDAGASKRPRNKEDEHPYSTTSGTVKDKMGFARRALQHINDKNDMSDEAWKLAEKIYKFIASQNP